MSLHSRVFVSKDVSFSLALEFAVTLTPTIIGCGYFVKWL